MATEAPLRRDAAANRERILDAARGLFAERGFETSMDDVARAAGVGAGTLYRRFATKEALLDAILGDVLERYRAFAPGGATRPTTPSPASSCCSSGRSGSSSRTGRSSSVLAVRLRDEPLLAEARERLRPLAEQLVTRAQAQGTLRADFAPADIHVLLWELGRVVESTGRIASELWRRYLALTLDGLRAEAARPLPHPPPSFDQLEQAMVEAAERRGLHRERPPRRPRG